MTGLVVEADKKRYPVEAAGIRKKFAFVKRISSQTFLDSWLKTEAKHGLEVDNKNI